ncbi:endonuclease/exonuclease/phosphatase family protein [Calothrix sp. UHCC 0171]|uniref:endonuclease/exonuclease/phosphatase family protein n=1 Tax=Calothrix sp. UHCC 0171 TaxID=3110245 RepID=UPI002B20C2C1|nr:endonuclease/exonuclease/phosphatase family protein [Calothrix sp. UHCC 0171]MEA5571473.1 endonuclease/exonuclease/phosphatase family protein [Calothrix sp. UHCC 0171]
MIRVVTINILFDMWMWDIRENLLIEGLRKTNADLIGLQEINIQGNTGDRIAEKLNMPYIYKVNYQKLPYNKGPEYGIAILSRYPFIQQKELDLQSQGRLAQYVQVEINHQPLIFCNGHYYWQPGSCQARMEQFKLLVNWLDELPKELPIITVGDFNATPDTPEVEFLRSHFISAYAQYCDREPEYTCPTPLVHLKRSVSKKIVLGIINAITHRNLKSWRGTLDYIFINQHLQVNDCQLILTEPAADNQYIYPSDHFGIAAELAIK